ncbi:uncharacterized protein si:cabz01068815.1 isoform X2 [Oreochromis niloticus]|uniref:uncharacterized protein si:cabz01068815.1 isoform X2 n=1 Tax=Oreochromis niloticus TaxID=8128 RepID=UPI000674F005|nr:uncharacterized protein LOC100708679 isoform X2 [Oreochromis niloticus]CAI5689536.1 unnamed protein product [Mustela putorius furo]
MFYQKQNMFDARILLLLFLSGARAFMIHNTQHNLCLEDSADTGEVQLKKCNLDSEYQQWIWISRDMLMCVASSRCLSAQHKGPVHTQDCHGPEVDAAWLIWDCDRDQLISRKLSMLLSHNGQHAILVQHSKHPKWRSLDQGDICQERLRHRRASDDSTYENEEQTGELTAMTKEQREYLRWFYRTEDPTTWTFALLGLAFVCLLVGFLLLGMGAMANKSRKKIAKYKAATSLLQKNEDQELLKENSTHPASDMPLQGNKPHMSNSDTSEQSNAGNIVVTWKDGNTSCLYPDPAVEEKQEEEKKETVTAAELDSADEVKIMS